MGLVTPITLEAVNTIYLPIRVTILFFVVAAIKIEGDVSNRVGTTIRIGLERAFLHISCHIVEIFLHRDLQTGDLLDPFAPLP